MSATRSKANRSGWSLRWIGGLFVLGASLLLSQSGGSAQVTSSDALHYFKNYFVTGDYVVGGVGLRGRGVNGLAAGSIEMGPTAVPAGADVLAAFLYWQTVATDVQSGAAGATFKGNPLSSVSGSIAKVISPEGGTAPCWASGGGTGSSGGSKRTYTYRADVLRFFDVGADGKFVINGAHAVQLPDSGSNGNAVPLALGASLVVIYRNPDPATPLNSIVIYDGGYTMDQSNESMVQKIRGFYQVAADSQGEVADKVTHIVGSGQANKAERLLFTGSAPIANPFAAAAGESWDNFTFFPSTPASGFAYESDGSQSVTTTVDHEGSGSFDCLTWGAVVYRTAVKDTDSDGLLDLWESSTVPLVDPGGEQLPRLVDMGATPTQPDLFVEIGYLYTASALSYGGVVKPQHSHRPDPLALQLVAEASHAQGVKVHFDVGADYQDGLPAPAACQSAWEWRCSIVPAGVARGGEAVDEMVTVCAPDATRPWVCQFSTFPGTVGWKTGFRFIRDALVDATDGSALATEGVCPPGTTCRARFDSNRKDIFHYVLFGHALGLPKSADVASPDFHTPRTSTGVADLPGGDAMVTLGAFDDVAGLPVGTPFMQASTLLHELGHNFWRRHGGDSGQPNCKPNYLSVMNYLFQLRGLLDASGVPHVDLSGQTLGPALNESSLGILGFDESTSAFPPYRTAWYAPQGTGTFGPAATKRCDGSENVDGASMVRVDALSTDVAIDWNPNPSGEGPSQDVNFDGAVNDGVSGRLLQGSNDWTQLRLNQVASRRNIGALYLRTTSPCSVSAPCLAVGPLSLDLGQGDLGQGDLGQGDLGQGDLGQGDLGQGDLGQGDLGRGLLGQGDLGQGDLGQGDLGQGDLGVGAPGEPTGELDFGIALALGRTPPNEVAACVIKAPADPGYDASCASGPSMPLHRVRVDWKAPHVGTALRYFVWRMLVDPAVPVTSLSTAVQVGAAVPAVLGQTEYSMIDAIQLPDGERFTYFVVAEFSDGPDDDVSPDLSAPSIFATIRAINAAPLALGDSYVVSGPILTVAASGVLLNDSDIDSPLTSLRAVLVTAPLQGTVTLNADGGFTYQPTPGYSGTDSFTYKANNGTFSYLTSGGTSATVPMSPDSAPVTVTLSVQPAGYVFVGLQNTPPPGNKTFKAGSSVPMKWQYKNGSTVVDSSQARFTVTVTGPLPNGPVRNITNTDSGSSSFRYSASTKEWTFNLQTKEANGSSYPTGTYNVVISSTTAGYLPSPIFGLRLVK